MGKQQSGQTGQDGGRLAPHAIPLGASTSLASENAVGIFFLDKELYPPIGLAFSLKPTGPYPQASTLHQVRKQLLFTAEAHPCSNN